MENSVTLAGKLAHDPITKKVGEDKDSLSCRFTLVIERKWNDRRSGDPKTYSTHHEVICYRDLAKNVSESCVEGDAVVVMGRLNTRKAPSGVGSNMITEIIADHVALNLSSGSIPID